MNRVTLEIREQGNIEQLLAQLPVLVRRTALQKALRQAGQIVASRARQRCPPPGYPGDKPGKKPLRDTIIVKVRDYGDVLVAIVGPWAPHAHLVEYGHQIVVGGPLKSGGRAVGAAAKHPFLRPAADETLAEQRLAIEETLRKELATL